MGCVPIIAKETHHANIDKIFIFIISATYPPHTKKIMEIYYRYMPWPANFG